MARTPTDHPQSRPVQQPPVAEQYPPRTIQPEPPTQRELDHQSKEAEVAAGYRPEPAQDPLRPPAPGSPEYVAGQPVDPWEAEVTEAEAQNRIRPEMRNLPEGVSSGHGTEEHPLHGALPYERPSTEQGTRPDGRPLASSPPYDDDVNKDPLQESLGTRADGRSRGPADSGL